jgi:hypothetical protein
MRQAFIGIPLPGLSGDYTAIGFEGKIWPNYGKSNQNFIGATTDSVTINGGSLNVLGEGHITASGNISASYESTGSFGRLLSHTIGGLSPISLTDDTSITGSLVVSGIISASVINSSGNLSSSGDLEIRNITASGDISSSGTIIANNFVGIFNGALSSSAQIADDISGSFTAGEGIDISSGVISGEDAASTNKGIATFNTDNFLVTSGDVTIKDGGVANIELVNDGITIAGVDTSLGGTITQTTLLAGSTVISSSILSSGTQGTAVLTSNGVNGSTIDLGLETTDNVIFNDISASGHITTLGNITASGDISASGNIYSDEVYTNGTNLKLYGNANDQRISGSQKIVLASQKYQFTSDNISSFAQTSFVQINGDTNIVGPITASGTISASGYIRANSYYIGAGEKYFARELNGSLEIAPSGGGLTNIKLSAPVTASGNISSSRQITATQYLTQQNSLTSSGTTQGTATVINLTNGGLLPITNSVNNAGVVLPTLEGIVNGSQVTIFNLSSTNALRVYPFSGQAIGNLAPDVGATLTSGQSLTIFRISDDQWFGSVGDAIS